MSWIELIATCFGIACVWLTIRRNIWCWPTGLLQVTLYIIVFYEAQLYSDMILHIVYVFMQLYGWYYWLYGGTENSGLNITRLGKHTLLWGGLAVVGTIVWGFLMGHYTDASVPYADAFTTVMSLIAQWLLAKKKLETWYFWILVDIVAIGVYWYKELYITTGLYALFLVLATMGLIEWRRVFRTEDRLSLHTT